jgi:predicted extracellular nuclease
MANVFINEIHYDNTGTDVGEAIELAGLAGIDLTDWSIVLYNGANGLVYTTTSLSGVIPDQDNGLGTVTFDYPTNGIQNGSPDGIALVDNNGSVVQFLSYEGSFIAVDGIAAGMTSIDIGVSQGSSTPIGASLQLTGTGRTYTDFAWMETTSDTFDGINQGQSFGNNSTPTTPLINEFVFNHTGSDTNEYVEIVADANSDYSNYSLLQIEGDRGSIPGKITTVNSLGTTDANGLWTTGFVNGRFQNGTQTLLLVENFTGSSGDDLDTDDDGVLDLTPWTTIADSIGVSDGDSGDRTYSAVVLTPGYDGISFTPGGASRFVNSTDESVTDWVRNDFDGSGIPGFSGSPVVGEAFNTPGTVNQRVTEESPTIIPIYDIQGIGHISSFEGESVITKGIVTAIDRNGFYLQDATGDSNNLTADGIFVFTQSQPTVSLGDELRVEGTVSEFIPGGADTGNLSITQISGNPTITTLSTGNALPTAVILGTDGRIPPNQIIDNDNFSIFDPAEDGIDFYETLEGMRVTVQDALAVSPINRFGEIFTVADNGVNATGLSNRGTINISPDDFNPERIQIQVDDDILPGFSPSVKVGDQLGDVTGVVGYSFGNFEVKATEAFTPTSSELQPEVTNLIWTENQLTVASFNVENLDPNDGDGDEDIAEGKFDAIANQIVNNLNTPDIIALQEIQDNTGSTNDGTVDASQTYQTLIDTIITAGGAEYEFFDSPPVNNQDGGQPGGNIRVGYLYNPDRVDLIPNSGERIGVGDPGFEDSRKSLAAEFLFKGEKVTLVNNHFASKGGSTPLFGQVQPPVNGSVDQREAQAQTVNDYVETILANDPDANVVVLGDLNEFEFLSPLDILKGESLTNLTETLPENERYSFIFRGNSQSLDHILISDNLSANAEFDAVHTNSEFNDSASDHDPLISRLSLAGDPNVFWGTSESEALVGTNANETLYGRMGDDTVAGGLGDDLIFGGEGSDVLRGDLNQRSPQSVGGDDVIYGGIGDDRIGGKAGNDTLYGEDGDDQMWGDAGDDILRGGLGNDRLVGDNFSGDRGRDIFILAVGEGTDTILDFRIEEDGIGLAEGLMFSQLNISQSGNDSLIQVNDETLAILNGVNADSLTSAVFTVI